MSTAPDPDPNAPAAAPTEPTDPASEAAALAAQHLADTTTMKMEGPSQLRTMMSNYFMEYASYVIKDRAIPDLDDGLKPVQRRILHSLWQEDDGRFHKVANIVGNTMKYHPHGDQSIYHALVHVANKEYFIDRQGNYGNIFTGDPPAAGRYIECRLSALAKEVLFNPEITTFVASYDGRNQEPVALPAKIPVLLLQGTEGIAVGMATRVLSHNFNEVLDAQIKYLRGEAFKLYPDFLQGGIMDVSEYDDGNGKVRLRAKIEPGEGKNTLVVREIPATTTTESLIASIEDANAKGKIKIASLTDYTAEKVEVEIQLIRGSDPERSIKALYAYTECEVPISVNCLVIKDNRPVIMNVTDVLKYNTDKLVRDLQRELEIELGKLNDQFHAKTLAQLFIENRIYKRIEQCETQELVLQAVHKGLAPFRAQLTRDVTDEDVEKLLQLAIRRISLFDINKNQQDLRDILARIEETKGHLANMRKFTINYLKALIKKYGPAHPRRTVISNLEDVNVRELAINNIRVGHDKANGYLGTAIKSDEPLICNEFDKLVVLGTDGTYKVVPIPDKLYVGAVSDVFKVDKKQVFGLIYRDRKSKVCFAKRFKIDSFIMEKEYRYVPEGGKVEKLFDRYGVVVRCEFEPMRGSKLDHIELDMENEEHAPLRSPAVRGIKIHDRKIEKFTLIKRGSETDPNAPADGGGNNGGGNGNGNGGSAPSPAASASTASSSAPRAASPAPAKVAAPPPAAPAPTKAVAPPKPAPPPPTKAAASPKAAAPPLARKTAIEVEPPTAPIPPAPRPRRFLDPSQDSTPKSPPAKPAKDSKDAKAGKTPGRFRIDEGSDFALD